MLQRLHCPIHESTLNFTYKQIINSLLINNFICFICRRQVKHIWLACLKTPICALFMPNVSLLCLKTSSWPDVFVVKEPKLIIYIPLNKLYFFFFFLTFFWVIFIHTFFFTNSYTIVCVCMCVIILICRNLIFFCIHLIINKCSFLRSVHLNDSR